MTREEREELRRRIDRVKRERLREARGGERTITRFALDASEGVPEVALALAIQYYPAFEGVR